MTPNPHTIESTAAVLSAGLTQIRENEGRDAALMHAAGLLMGGVIGLAEFTTGDALASTIDGMVAGAEGGPLADIAAIPHPRPEDLHAVAHYIVRAVRKVRAAEGDAAARDRAAAALLAGSRAVRGLTDGATLALLLQAYANRARAAGALIEAGDLPDTVALQ